MTFCNPIGTPITINFVDDQEKKQVLLILTGFCLVNIYVGTIIDVV